MDKIKKILIVEDELITAKYYARILRELNYSIDIAYDGQQALELVNENNYDIIITDWLMPKINGVNLIKIIRNNLTIQPLIIMITTLGSEMSKNLAMESGADDFLTKPIKSDELISTIQNLIKRKEFNTKLYSTLDEPYKVIKKPNFIAIGIATSTGGPPTLLKLFEKITYSPYVSFFIVQHGPDWMFYTFQKRLQSITPFTVELTENNLSLKSGHIYIARGNYHSIIDYETQKLKLLDTEEINFVKPSADPLLKSIAQNFGEYSLAIILTGLGSDGSNGAMYIYKYGGEVIIQNINEAIASSMPKSIIKNGIPHKEKKLLEIPDYLNEFIINKTKKLNISLSEK